MKVISVPGRLRLAALLLVLAVPIAALETIIATRAPWWRLPYAAIESSCTVAGLTFLPLTVAILNGKRPAWWFAVGLLTLWVGFSGWLAVRSHHPALGFFTLFLLLFFGMIVSWIDQELDRSYFEPRLRWYHGLPKPVPGVTCQAEVGGAAHRFRVARLDEEGAFLFLPGGKRLEPFPLHDPLLLSFEFRDHRVSCAGVPVRILRERQGVGVQFGALTPDGRKELGDFVERLKGEGYVD